MIRQVGWIMTTALLALLLWQTVVGDPALPRAVSGLLLVIVSTLAGIRIGTESSAGYIKDLQRLNKVVADQHRQLEEMNAVLVKQLQSSPTKPPDGA